LIAKATGTAKLSGSLASESSASRSFARRGLLQVIKEVSNSDYVVLIDDFHYIPRSVQQEVARSLKAAVQEGVRIATASVPHRGDDLLRANADLRGRVRTLDIVYWARADLERIANIGFAKLNVQLPQETIEAFALEAAGSPQLLQQICLEACFETGIRGKELMKRKVGVEFHTLRNIFERSSASASFRSMVQLLSTGPKSRDRHRKSYAFDDGKRGDVYQCVLRLLAMDPPMASFDLESLQLRASRMCVGEAPSTNLLLRVCERLVRLAHAAFPTERAIEWDENRRALVISDPYLLFFLRWSSAASSG
jgi:hypothetical protein